MTRTKQFLALTIVALATLNARAADVCEKNKTAALANSKIKAALKGRDPFVKWKVVQPANKDYTIEVSENGELAVIDNATNKKTMTLKGQICVDAGGSLYLSASLVKIKFDPTKLTIEVPGLGYVAKRDPQPVDGGSTPLSTSGTVAVRAAVK